MRGDAREFSLKHSSLGATQAAHNDGRVDRRSEQVTGDMRSPTATDARVGPCRRAGNSNDLAGHVVIDHGLASGLPIRMREHALLTCTFGWMLRARTCDLRLRRGGAHTSFGRDTKISIAYGPQAYLEIDLDSEVPIKRPLTSRFAWALRDSNPRPPSCKSGRGVSEGAGQDVETMDDLRERVSVTTARYPCVAVRHGLQTDLKPTATRNQIASPLPFSFSLYLSGHVGLAISHGGGSDGVRCACYRVPDRHFGDVRAGVSAGALSDTRSGRGQRCFDECRTAVMAARLRDE